MTDPTNDALHAERIERLTELARRVWPGDEVEVRARGDAVRILPGAMPDTGMPQIVLPFAVMVHPRALDALEAALRVLAGCKVEPMTDEAESPSVCPVCGEEVDDFGCLGEMRGRHVPIVQAQLRARAEAAEKRIAALAKQFDELAEMAEAAMEMDAARAYRYCAHIAPRFVEEPSPESLAEIPEVSPDALSLGRGVVGMTLARLLPKGWRPTQAQCDAAQLALTGQPPAWVYDLAREYERRADEAPGGITSTLYREFAFELRKAARATVVTHLEKP